MQHEGEAEADEQRVLLARLLVGAHDEAEERPVQDDPREQGERDHEDERSERIHAQEGDGPEGCVAAEHDQLAVRDVEDLEDAEDERQPGRREPVEAADQDTQDDLLSEGAHARVASGPR